ncbi:MAG: choice-of-anchor W domain-containing protein [Planctomycetota bacterium]
MRRRLIATEVADDAAFNALGLDPVFEAQGRIANNANNGDQEADLGPTTAAPVAQAQGVWASGQGFDFTLDYNAATNLVSWQIFGQTMEYTASADATALAIRVRATNQASNMAVDLDGLLVDGVTPPIDSVGAANPGDGVQYLIISGSELLDGFTLTGTATLTFDAGDQPSGSNLAFQIKGVVPSPMTGAFALAGAPLLLRRRR